MKEEYGAKVRIKRKKMKIKEEGKITKEIRIKRRERRGEIGKEGTRNRYKKGLEKESII